MLYGNAPSSTFFKVAFWLTNIIKWLPDIKIICLPAKKDTLYNITLTA